jgi:hypothetical protein
VRHVIHRNRGELPAMPSSSGPSRSTQCYMITQLTSCVKESVGRSGTAAAAMHGEHQMRIDRIGKRNQSSVPLRGGIIATQRARPPVGKRARRWTYLIGVALLSVLGSPGRMLFDLPVPALVVDKWPPVDRDPDAMVCCPGMASGPTREYGRHPAAHPTQSTEVVPVH